MHPHPRFYGVADFYLKSKPPFYFFHADDADFRRISLANIFLFGTQNSQNSQTFARAALVLAIRNVNTRLADGCERSNAANSV